MKKNTWEDAINRVLEEEDRVMTSAEITKMIIDKGYYYTKAKDFDTALGAVASILSKNEKKGLYRHMPEGDKSTGGYTLAALGGITVVNGIEISDKYNCATVSFVDRVKNVYNNKVAPSFEKICDRKYAFILKDIPIHFGERHRYLENKNNYVNDDAKNYLGYYSRTSGDNEREIILFEDVITSAAPYDVEYLDNLIWKVIVHEYAHAIMDSMHNGLDVLEQQDPELCKYREESLANAFALKVLEKSLGTTIITHSGFDKIKEFVMNQAEEYRHGLKLYQRDDLLKMMEFWRGVKIIGNQGF